MQLIKVQLTKFICIIENYQLQKFEHWLIHRRYFSHQNTGCRRNGTNQLFCFHMFYKNIFCTFFKVFNNKHAEN